MLKKYSILPLFAFCICISVATATPLVLYNGSGNESPSMTASTWPEQPEYYANWGNLDGMSPPYIRLSGQSGETRDWAGAFAFANLPAKVLGGSLQIQARATSNVSISVWLETSEGNSAAKTHSLSASQTSNLDISISDFGIMPQAVVHKIYIQMNQVPAWQHTTVFFDNIILSNAEKADASGNQGGSGQEGGQSNDNQAAVSADAKTFESYLIAADTVAISDYAKTLGGDIYGNVLEIGADAKILGSVAANAKCFLRERAGISGTLSFPASCAKQNGITIGKETRERTEYARTIVENISAGSQSKSVAIGADERLLPGAYGNLRIDARSTVRLESGSYAFSSIHTEPDARWHFDLSNGPVKIYVQSGIRFADRNTFAMANGNPSEIEWHVASGSVDIGTDGKFFGRFIAPVSRVRLATRSHVVGGIEARHFQMEPQSTVSMEPRAEEISHSRHNFGPFWNKNLFRYRSALPASISAIEMHVYAQGYDIRIDGSEDRNVNLEKISQKVSVKITRPFIADFPPEAFSSVYEYSFSKTSNNRIYWNPHSPCVSNCYGNSEESALRSFPQALADAQKDGLEVKMTGGVWEAGKEHSVFPVGLRLTGIEKPFWELSSFSEIPSINVKNYPIEIAGKSPRSLAGLHITGGTNGGLRASTERLELANLAFTQNESNGDGGALHYGGKGLLAGNVLLFENGRGNRGGGAFIDGDAEIENLVCSGNSSELEGGCLSVQGSLRLSNAVFHRNRSKQQGGAFRARNAAVLNATAVGNESNGNAFSGAAGSVFNSIFWQNAGGLDIPGSWAAQHSSFPSSRAGTGNIRGNPAFVNEGNAAGSARFFGYDAGLVLADKSPALKGNKDVVGTLDADLLGAEWGNAVAMGAYGDYNSDDNEFQYMTWDHGNLKKAVPARPLFPSFADQNIEDYISYGRIIMRLVKKHDKTKISKARVRITLLDSTAKAYPDAKPIEISFHRFKESDGKYREVDKKYVFSTLIHSIRPGYNAEEHGRVILFSRDPNDQGIYDKVIIIHAKEISDRFRYEVIR